MSWKKTLSLAVIAQAIIVLLSGVATLHGQTLGAKTITVSGSEQSSGGNWDTGTATLTVVTSAGTYTKTMSGGGAWGQYSTPASIASWLAARISMDTSAPVWAKANRATITLVPRVLFTPITVSGSTTYDSAHFGAPSFRLDTNSSTTPDSNMIISCTPSVIGPGQTTSCTATITGDDATLAGHLPANPVTFKINGSFWTSASVDSHGNAAVSGGLSGAGAGTYAIVAHYSDAGDSYYTTDMDAKTYVTVNSSDPTTSAVYSYKIYQSDGTTPGFDANGNITAYYETTSGQWQNIQYDSLNRIIRADGPSGLAGGSPYFCWTYDIYGNRTQQNLGTSAFTASSGSCSGGGTVTTDGQTYDNNNRITTADHPSATFTPDASGNLQNDDAHGYTYDAEGHLCAMSTTILSITTYRGYLYDASGIRIAQGTQNSMSCDLSSNGFTMTNMYVQGADGETMTETDGSGVWQHTDVGAGGLVATYDNIGLHFHATDWLGSRKAQTDYAGMLEYGYQYKPFGEIAGGSDSGATEKLFTGQEHDHYSGLDYFKARYYGSSIGRFMSPDPSGLLYADPTNPQTVNLYSYALNNPLLFIDPTGLADGCFSNTGQQIDVVPEQCSNAGGAWGPDGKDPITQDADGRFSLRVGAYGSVASQGGSGGGSGNNPNAPGNFNCHDLAAGKTPSGSASSWWAGYVNASSMLDNWLAGTGPTSTTFGPNSPESQQMMGAYGLAGNVNAFLSGGRASGFQNFGIRGLLTSGLNPTAQFVGSYGWSMSLSDGNLNITLRNATTMYSAFYHAPGLNPNPPTRFDSVLNPGRHPMGRVNQIFQIQVPCS